MRPGCHRARPIPLRLDHSRETRLVDPCRGRVTARIDPDVDLGRLMTLSSARSLHAPAHHLRRRLPQILSPCLVRQGGRYRATVSVYRLVRPPLRLTARRENLPEGRPPTADRRQSTRLKPACSKPHSRHSCDSALASIPMLAHRRHEPSVAHSHEDQTGGSGCHRAARLAAQERDGCRSGSQS